MGLMTMPTKADVKHLQGFMKRVEKRSISSGSAVVKKLKARAVEEERTLQKISGK